MKVSEEKIFDAATLAKAIKLIAEAKLTLTEICEELNTTLPVLTKNMDSHFAIAADEGETDWRKIYRTKRDIDKRKKNTRIVYECQSCSYESKVEIVCCPKCGSYCVEQRELKNNMSRGQRMAGSRLWLQRK